MSDSLYRAIIGQIEPLRKFDEVPVIYRRTLPVPPAPLQGSASGEPLGDFDPTEEYPTTQPLPY